MNNINRILLIVLVMCTFADAQRLPNRPAEPAPGQGPHPKKGVCLATSSNNAVDWAARVKALHPSWHYSWGARLPAAEPPGVEFVPMVWGIQSVNDKFLDTMASLTAAKSAQARKHLLGFNEPDSLTQANMSVAQALEAWPYLMKTGLRLGSPATVHPEGEWMQAFMKQAEEKQYRVDFVCVHWYGGTNAKEFVDRLENIHKKYGKPIWITEFAVADWEATRLENNRFSPQRILQFMEAVLPQLDALDFVERYAWFSWEEKDKALGPSALFKDDGSLTVLGQFYALHPYAGPKAGRSRNQAGQ